MTEQLMQALSHTLFSYGGSTVSVLSLLIAGIFALAFFIFMTRFNKIFIKRVLAGRKIQKRTKREALIIARYLLIFAGACITLKLTGLDMWLYSHLVNFQKQLSAVVDLKLFSLGKTPITLWTTVYLLILSWLLVRLTGQLEERVVKKLLYRTRIDPGMSETIATVIRYAAVSIGMVVILQSTGIDLSAITVMAGAMGITIGLGLQGIMNNFVSGLVILFDRPIKVGDRIDIGGTTGDVAKVSLRTTTILTNDDIAIIVPNSEFITSKVINWTFTGKKCGFNFPVRVAYGSDPELVKRVLLECAHEHPGVLKAPKPSVLFKEFGETALIFSLNVWTTDYVTRSGRLRSDMNYAISEKFRQYQIECPPGDKSNCEVIAESDESSQNSDESDQFKQSA